VEINTPLGIVLVLLVVILGGIVLWYAP